ncbi:tetraspanin-10 [Boleophthalmus pectinirostris]|uniref:tetraspanin-10 n=1 Tax=Boleophthalmus pectinirostris TaxID=150288 RepID=UPI000A1C2EF6|nr:tetraspanin-10 [Boleophthalmus pectinirostris]
MWKFTRKITFPWQKGEFTENETSPLLPKAGPAHGDIEEDTQNNTNQEGTKNGENTRNTKIEYFHRYTAMDYFLKYFLFFCNLLFTILGLIVLGLGMWGLVSKESFAQEKIGSIGTDPMLVLVSVGLLLFMLCLTGCVGALRENSCLLKVFSAVVLALIAAQVVVAILAYSLQDQIGNYLRSGMLAAMERYQDDLDLRFIVDEIQTNLQCCGADTYRDWEINIYYNCSAPGVLACGVPATCCVDPLENGTVWNSQCGVGAQTLDEFTAQSVVFLGGCLGGISRWIQQHEGLIGTVAIVVLGAQMVALFITTRLIESIHWHKSYARNYYMPGL